MFFYLSRKKSPFKSPLNPRCAIWETITHQLCFATPRYFSRFTKGENIKPPSSCTLGRSPTGEPSPLWGEGNTFPSLLPPYLNPLPCGERVRVRGIFYTFPVPFCFSFILAIFYFSFIGNNILFSNLYLFPQ